MLIKSEMDNNIYHMIKGIKKVSGFLGSKGMPSPVSEKKIEKILGQIKDGVTQGQLAIEYSVGEKVQVIDGPFASFNGMVEDIDEEKSRLKVSVLIFGRPTPVELEYNQVEKSKLMAKKEISGYVKLQIKGGQANPAPPVGPALGQRGINIMEFCKAFNEKTKEFMGKPVPVVITVYKDKKFDFIIKTPPASHFIKEAAKIKGGSQDQVEILLHQ